MKNLQEPRNLVSRYSAYILLPEYGFHFPEVYNYIYKITLVKWGKHILTPQITGLFAVYLSIEIL